MTLYTKMNREYLTEREANAYSPLTLAFLGDSVYDTLVRDYLLRLANTSVSKLHAMKIRLVCAEFQSGVYDLIADNLDEKELSVLKRGRNATGNTVPKHSDAVDYRRATAVECLFGYLFLTGKFGRISSLFDLILEKASKTLDNIE